MTWEQLDARTGRQSSCRRRHTLRTLTRSLRAARWTATGIVPVVPAVRSRRVCVDHHRWVAALVLAFTFFFMELNLMGRHSTGVDHVTHRTTRQRGRGSCCGRGWMSRERRCAVSDM